MSRVIDSDLSHYFQRLESNMKNDSNWVNGPKWPQLILDLLIFAVTQLQLVQSKFIKIIVIVVLGKNNEPCEVVNNENFETLSENIWGFAYSLGPVYEFVCDSFRTGNLNCFRVEWPWRSTWHMCENLNPGRKSWKWPRPETAVST